MDDVTISLLAPAPRAGVDGWIEPQVERIRFNADRMGVGLGRLVRSRPAQGGDWLIAVDRRDREGPVEDDVALAGIVLAFERLGLRPAVFVSTGRRAVAHSRRPSPTGPPSTPRDRPRARRTRPSSR